MYPFYNFLIGSDWIGRGEILRIACQASVAGEGIRIFLCLPAGQVGNGLPDEVVQVQLAGFH